LTIAYVSKPELFTLKRYRVDVELTGAHSSGQTVADVYGYLKVDDTWGRTGKNCEVATDLDVRTVHISPFWHADHFAGRGILRVDP
jgi:uridine nucleosidase